MKFEFATRNTDDTLGTMVPDAYVNHVPVMTGGVGHDELAVIDAAELERVRKSAPGWYASIRERGIRNGDRATYDIDGASMRSVPSVP